MLCTFLPQAKPRPPAAVARLQLRRSETVPGIPLPAAGLPGQAHQPLLSTQHSQVREEVGPAHHVPVTVHMSLQEAAGGLPRGQCSALPSHWLQPSPSAQRRQEVSCMALGIAYIILVYYIHDIVVM